MQTGARRNSHGGFRGNVCNQFSVNLFKNAPLKLGRDALMHNLQHTNQMRKKNCTFCSPEILKPPSLPPHLPALYYYLYSIC